MYCRGHQGAGEGTNILHPQDNIVHAGQHVPPEQEHLERCARGLAILHGAGSGVPETVSVVLV